MMRVQPHLPAAAVRAATGLLWLWAVLCGVMAMTVHADPLPAEPPPPMLEVFVRTGCPHCAAAKDYLPALAAANPGLHIVVREVDRDPQARSDLIRHSQAAEVWPPGVPTFVSGGRVLVGFDNAERSGPLLAGLLTRQAPAAPRTYESAWFGSLSASRLGLPAFTLALGLLDGFNPCAMWVLLFLLSLLVRLRDRRRMALIAGTFVLVSGTVYYAFMAAWLNVFLLTGFSDALRFTLAALALLIGGVNVRDAWQAEEGYTLAIPAAAKPGLYARLRAILSAGALLPSLTGVAALAVLVNFVELLCTAGLPAMYTAVLAQQGLEPTAHYAYLGLYILGYIADDSLMVAAAVLALGNQRLSLRAGRGLKALSGLVMLALGAMMLFFPGWLL
jgi:glutaredoxin